jgi:hypothetical protein
VLQAIAFVGLARVKDLSLSLERRAENPDLPFALPDFAKSRFVARGHP